MRYCIKGRDIVALSDEIGIVRQYLSIISIRFDNRFAFEIDIPESVQAVKMPRFILQPLVENAIYHGLEPKYGAGRLRIYCCGEAPGTVQICIADNGAGIPPDILQKIHAELSGSSPQSLFGVESQKGLALLNINQRIRQFFGPEYGLSLESTPGSGTLVRISIPAEAPEPPAPAD